MLRVFNATARYVDQGGNKRPGAFAIYLEPWHPDIFDFLDLKKNTGKEEQVLVIWLLRNQLIKWWWVKSAVFSPGRGLVGFPQEKTEMAH